MNKTRALTLLADDDTVASAICKAAETVLGDGWLVWEPESIWKELHHEGVDVPLGNRQQLMAGRGLLIHGRFYYDGLVFDRTCAAFSNEVLNMDALDETLAMHLAWGVNEAAKLCELFEHTPEPFDREVVTVCAAQLWEEGMVLAPDELSFAQTALDKEWSVECCGLKDKVQRAWADLRGHSLRDVPYPETPGGVQLARLAAIATFLDERRRLRDRQLTG